MTITAIPIRTSTHDITLELESHGSISDEWIYINGREVGYRGWMLHGRRWIKRMPLVELADPLEVTLRCTGAEGAHCRLVVRVDGVEMGNPLCAVVEHGTGRDARAFAVGGPIAAR